MTNEFTEVLLRHTLAQQLRDAALASEEISDAFGWKTSGTISTWCAKTSEGCSDLGFSGDHMFFVPTLTHSY